MTVIRPNSIAGINSITVQSGQALNIHDASGNVIRNLTSSSGVSTYQALHVGSGTTTSTQGISVGTGCSIVSDSVNTLDVYTNNSNRLRIASDGKIGIGTDNPASLLNLSGSQPRITFNDTSGTDDTAKIFSSSGALYLQQRDGSSHGEIIFRTENNSTAVERLRIDTSGRLGIQGAASRGILEVRASGGSNTMLTAVFGANEGTTAGTLSDNTDKACRMGIHHYDTDALPYGLLVGSSSNGVNNLTFGGGTSLMNAATEIKFNTAANTTTTSGSERFQIASAGQLGIGGANYGTSGQVLTSGGASAAPSWADAGGGTQDFDRWHLTADTSGNTDPIQNNWSRWTANSGTGTVTFSAPSSGLWTFPSTGFWYIDWYGMFHVDNKAERGCNLYLYATTNDSSYAFVTASETSAHDSSAVTKTWSRCTYVFDVTDTSTHKVKFACGYNQSSNTLLGHGSYLYSNVLFVKLRDT